MRLSVFKVLYAHLNIREKDHRSLPLQIDSFSLALLLRARSNIASSQTFGTKHQQSDILFTWLSVSRDQSCF